MITTGSGNGFDWENMMSMIALKRAMRRIREAASFRGEISPGRQFGIVILLIALLGGYGAWVIHGMEMRRAQQQAQLLEQGRGAATKAAMQ